MIQFTNDVISCCSLDQSQKKSLHNLKSHLIKTKQNCDSLNYGFDLIKVSYRYDKLLNVLEKKDQRFMSAEICKKYIQILLSCL